MFVAFGCREYVELIPFDLGRIGIDMLADHPGVIRYKTQGMVLILDDRDHHAH